MILIDITFSKQPQRSSFEASIDSLHRHNDFHQNRFFEAATAQVLRGSHSRWIRCAGAAILIEIVFPKQSHRNSFDAATIDGIIAQLNDFHRKSQLRSSHRAAPPRQPHSMDSPHKRSDSHRARSFEAAIIATKDLYNPFGSLTPNIYMYIIFGV